ncbi:MAG: AAA family ATPase [Nitrospinota bacterium]
MSQIDMPLFPLPHQKQIWAVGGCKGGTGKTIVTVSLGILLSRLGHRVVLIDTDLGGANLHTCAGIRYPAKTISDFLLKKTNSLEDLLTETSIENLKIISGANDSLTIANLPHVQKLKLIHHIRRLPADYIILDLGAGTSFNVLDIFLMADSGIVVITPEPTSVENVYRFIKSAILRKISNYLSDLKYNDILKEAVASKENGPLNSIRDLVEKINRIDSSISASLEEKISSFYPKVIINQVRANDNMMLGMSIKDIANKYLGVNLDYVGYIPYDETVHESVKRFKPLIIEYPNCSVSLCMSLTLKKLLNGKEPLRSIDAGQII